MKTSQKIIKYLAIAFAVFLIVSIFFGIFSVLYALGTTFGLYEKEHHTQLPAQTYEAYEIDDLEIDLAYADLEILIGEQFSVSCSDSRITVEKEGRGLEISDEGFRLHHSADQRQVTVCVPEDHIFRELSVDNGAGVIRAELLQAEELELKLGAGECTVEILNVEKEADIDGGAGEIHILAGKIQNLDFDMGVGACTLSAALTGESHVNCGIGELNLEILGERSDYTMDFENGIGEILLEGVLVESGSQLGIGEHYLKMSGGIGRTEISFAESIL